MKQSLICGCVVDYDKLKKKPKINCPKCKEMVFDASYCVCCGFKLQGETDVRTR